MNEYRLLVDEIQRMVRSPSPDVATVRHLAAEYQLACDQTNDRLRQCEELLRLGMRAEAIRQCEQEPNLLKLVNLLDLPELHHWHALLTRCGIDAICGVLVDVSADLNEAYSKEKQMASLVRKHRMLALARAPLRDRIRILSQLRTADLDNEMWEDDLCQYQKERLLEIEREATLAAQRNDLSSLESMHEEITGNGWVESPSQTMAARRVTALLVEQRVFHAQEEVRILAPALHNAFLRRDIVDGRRLREKWQACAALLNSRVDVALDQTVAPALQWLSKCDQEEAAEHEFHEGLANLQAVLSFDHTRQQLRNAYESVLRLGQPLPPDLVQQCESRLRWLDTVGLLRRILLVACLLSLLVAVVAGVVVAVRITRTHLEQERANAELLDVIHADDYAGARDCWDRLPAATINALPVSTRQAFASLCNAHEFNKECGRTIARLEQSLRDVRAKVSGATIETASAVDDCSTLFAKLNVEHRDFLKKLSGKTLSQQQRDWTRQFAERVARVEAELSQLEKSQEWKEHTATIHGYIRTGELNFARSSLGTLEKRTLSGEQKAELRDLWFALGVRVEDARREAIMEAVGDVNRFQSSLESLRTMLGESPYAAHLESAIREKVVWEDVLQFNELVTEWARNEPPDTAQQARAWLDRLEPLKSAPLHGSLRTRFAVETAKYLTHIAAREPTDNQPLFDQLKAYLNRGYVHDLMVITANDGGKYYTREKPVEKGYGNRKKYTVNVLNGFGDDDIANQTLYDADYTAAPAYLRVRPEAKPAPHSVLASSLEKVLDEDRRWDQRMGAVLRQLIAASDAEPLLQIELLSEAIVIARAGSYAWHESLAEAESIVDAPGVDSATEWMIPPPKDAERVAIERSKAAKRIEQLRMAWSGIEKNWKQYDSRLRNPMPCRYRWLGWVGHDERGLRLRLPKDQAAGDLMVFRLTSDGLTMEEQRIGTFDTGHERLNATFAQMASNQLYGRPVFLCTTTP